MRTLRSRDGAHGPAVSDHGPFEHAHHGTLLWDEIGERPLELLLRVLREQELEPLASARTIRVEVTSPARGYELGPGTDGRKSPVPC
jgi:transcriptional regulator with GAF, ATPase, and Fis domain